MKKKHELIYEPAFYIFKVTVGKKRTKVLFNYVGNQQTASFFFSLFSGDLGCICFLASVLTDARSFA